MSLFYTQDSVAASQEECLADIRMDASDTMESSSNGYRPGLIDYGTQSQSTDFPATAPSQLNSSTLSSFSHIFHNKANLGDFHGSKVKRPNDQTAEEASQLPTKRLDVDVAAEPIYLTGMMTQPNAKVDDMVGARLLSDFSILETVGSGMFGKVYKAKSNVDLGMYAIKVSRRPCNTAGHSSQSMMQEVMALARLSSQEDSTEQEGGEEVTPPGSEVSPFHSIVRYYGAWIENDLLHIQMELCEMSVEHIFNEYQKQLMQAVDGDVKAPPAPSQAEDDMDLLGLDRPKTPANQMIDPFAFSCPPSTVKKVIPAEVENSVTYPFDSKQMLQMLRDMLVALKFMHRYELQREHVFVVRGACVHSHDYVHLDIKPGNILVKGNHYKLGDFGLAMKVSKGAGGSDGLEEGDSKYMARELLDWGNKDLTKCDLFSLGATMFELCDGHVLPAEGREWHDLRSNKFGLPRKIKEPNELMALLRILLHPTPAERSSAAQLLKEHVSIMSEMEKELYFSRICMEQMKNRLLESEHASSTKSGVGATTTSRIRRMHTVT